VTADRCLPGASRRARQEGPRSSLGTYGDPYSSPLHVRRHASLSNSAGCDVTREAERSVPIGGAPAR
jgi:hypothetical protein